MIDCTKQKAKYKLTPRKISENEIKHQVKQYLDLKGWFNFHLLAGMGCYPGLPDRIAIKNGRTLFLEIKKPIGGIHRDNQKIFQENIERAGEEYFLIRNLEDLIEGLKSKV
jgi:hypothetical protein